MLLPVSGPAAVRTPNAKPTPPPVKNFLKEYWLWILIPFVVVIGALIALYFLAGGDAVSPFQYKI